MNIRDRLRSIEWLHRLHKWYWGRRTWFSETYWQPFIWWLALHLLPNVVFPWHLFKIRVVYGKRPLRVAFPLCNPSKWKLQSLYDLMDKSDKFDPFVVITPMDQESFLSLEERAIALKKVEDFLNSRGIRFVYGYDVDSGCFVPFKRFKPDIVWYTQPWFIYWKQFPLKVSYGCLTCYTPYFVQNYGALDMDCGLDFHKMLWRHFTLSDAWAQEFMRYIGERRVGEVKGLGHPMLDNFYLRRDEQPESKYVIYAPHFSCNIVECYSTFLKNGKAILELAKLHPEIKWVFKPHPSLRKTLERECGWDKEAVDSYYSQWEHIAVSCYDANYVSLFKESSAMITDCASFLVEYACTGKPIIHLISSNVKYEPHPIATNLFGSYYQAHNWEEFIRHFDRVILNQDDYKREERIAAVKEMRLLDNYAAKNIIDYLDKEFGCK